MCKIERIFDETIELADNAMLKIRPDLFGEWDFDKNDKLGFDIYKVTKGSNKIAYWKCDRNHEWGIGINSRTGKKSSCPYCSGRYAWKGESDMWTTNPELAELLLNHEDGYKYMQSSGKRVNWKCSSCEEVINNKIINEIKRRGLSCPKCSDGKSFGEKFIYNTLRYLQTKFKWDESFEWSKGKRYDFFLPEKNMIIEAHGRQHYKDSGFKLLGGRTLAEEIENDIYKRELALANGIKYYIELDFDDSNMMKHTIENVENNLSDFFNLKNIDWKRIESRSRLSIVKTVADMWNKNIKIKDIIEYLCISETTVSRYLKIANRVGLCKYNASGNARVIIQLDIDNNKIKEWDSLKQAGKFFNEKRGAAIWRALNGKNRTSHGFKWMYKEDYDNLVSSSEKQII